MKIKQFKFWLFMVLGIGFIIWGAAKISPEQEGLVEYIVGITILTWELFGERK